MTFYIYAISAHIFCMGNSVFFFCPITYALIDALVDAYLQFFVYQWSSVGSDNKTKLAMLTKDELGGQSAKGEVGSRRINQNSNGLRPLNSPIWPHVSVGARLKVPGLDSLMPDPDIGLMGYQLTPSRCVRRRPRPPPRNSLPPQILIVIIIIIIMCLLQKPT